MEKLYKQLIQAKQRMESLPDEIAELKRKEANLRASAQVDNLPSREVLAEGIADNYKQKEKLLTVLPDALNLLRQRLVEAAIKSGGKAAQDLLNQRPKMEKELQSAQTRLDSAIAGASEAASTIWGRFRDEKIASMISKKVVGYLKENSQSLPEQGLKQKISGIPQRTQFLQDFRVQLRQIGVDEEELSECLQVHTLDQRRQREEAELKGRQSHMEKDKKKTENLSKLLKELAGAVRGS